MSFYLVCALVSLIINLVQGVCSHIQCKLCWKASQQAWREWDQKTTGHSPKVLACFFFCFSLKFAAMQWTWSDIWDLSVHCLAGNNSSRNVLHSMQHKGMYIYMFTPFKCCWCKTAAWSCANSCSSETCKETMRHPSVSAWECRWLQGDVVYEILKENHWTFWYLICVLHDCRELRAQSNDSLVDWTCISHEDAAGADYIQGWFRSCINFSAHTQIITTVQ